MVDVPKDQTKQSHMFNNYLSQVYDTGAPNEGQTRQSSDNL